MKTQINLLLLRALTLSTLLSATNLAWAYYDPGGQRWINRDSLGELGGVNLYECVRNSPETHLDADGHNVCDCAKALAELAAAAATVAGRVADINDTVEAGGKPDAGHLKALKQAQTSLKNALQKVAKYCGGVLGAAGAATAATAALEAAAAILEEYGWALIFGV